MSKYILSLDFDGVLHPFGSKGGALFQKMPMIYRLLEQYPAIKVIVHSSWRHFHDSDELGEMLFHDRPDLADRYLGVTPIQAMSRWESILAWIKLNKPVSVCVLDDEPRMFPGHVPLGQDPRICFIECPTTEGLAEGHPALDSWARSTLTEKV